jgi:AraC-like DNA-binding protein
MFSVVLKMLLLLKAACGKDSEQKPLPSDELIVKIIDVINREYASISSVCDLAEKLNYSKNYLSSYFKSQMDIGLHDFLVMKKLSIAGAKLLSGKSVTEAAFECGFGSTAYFISSFKARYGVTPGKYLQENR